VNPRRDESGPVGDDALRADLVALALHQLPADEAEALRERVLSTPALAAELESIRRHFDFHAAVPEIQPSPMQFDRIREAIREEEQALAAPRPRSFWRRYWMSAAAAALLIAALILPRPDGPATTDPAPAMVAVAGDVAATPDGSWTSNTVSRVRFGDGVVVTLDAGTIVKPLGSQRLFLRKGRIFLEVEPSRRGLSVVTAPFEARTTGTAFLVESAASESRVAVESGTVEVAYRGSEPVPVPAGHELRSPAREASKIPQDRPLRWFEIPSLSAKILNPSTLRVVLHNEMIDDITLAPPKSGKPLFFATVGSHSYPHEPANFGRNVRIPPGGSFDFLMTLPAPLEARDAVFVRCPSLGLEVEARR